MYLSMKKWKDNKRTKLIYCIEFWALYNARRPIYCIQPHHVTNTLSHSITQPNRVLGPI